MGRAFDEQPTGLHSIKPDTSVKLSIVLFLGTLAAVASGVWATARFIGGLEFEQRAQRSMIDDLPKRRELEALERRVTGALRKQMKGAMLRCPRAASGRGGAGAWMDCQVIFHQPANEE